MAELRIRVEGLRPAFAPRARWVLETLAEALGSEPRFVAGEADLHYAPEPPVRGVWIPADSAAQAFFEGGETFPATAVHRASGLTLLFAPTAPGAPIPGDVVASAFYLLARWDELRVAERDEFGRLPLSASAFGRIAGLSLEDPPVEGYIRALRQALGLPPPAGWSVALTHDIDRIRRRTARGLAATAARRGPGAVARLLAGPDPWDNVPDLLAAAWQRGLCSTVFLIGRNRHRLDGTPRRAYERERRRMAAAVQAAGGEVGLHASFGASEDGAALRDELLALRTETGLPVEGVRFHYLRFRYHETVRRLEDAGARWDSSLGFSEAPGYAAGIARPFRPWIVGEERPARLHLLPLAVMDTQLRSRLGLDAASARERALAVLEAARAAGGRVALLWHNTYLADDRAPGYGPLLHDLLDELRERGAVIGPAGAPPAPAPGADLRGRRVLHLTTVHRPRDVRIFHKEAQAAARAGARTWVAAPATPLTRGARPFGGARLARAARRHHADLIHVHDPELLLVALWLRRTGVPVVYDVHEYLGETTRTKRWLPAALRRPIAIAAARLERASARRLDGVVTANEDLAARFAAAGARAVAVTNSPWSDAFPEPAPPAADPVALYVGGLGPLRGIEVIRAASALLGTPGARVVLAGPGDPGAMPACVEALGRIDHLEVPGLLARARVAWIPLQRHGNYDRAVPTKLVEAMAAGRAVVASDLGRMGAIVRDAGCGLLVAPDDPRAHAAALDELLGDPERAAAMGASGRAAFLDGLGFEPQARALTTLYAELMAS